MPRSSFFPLLLLFIFSALVSGSYLNYCNNFELVLSKLSNKRLFLKADCLGVYGNTTQTQCSYLDLSQCFALRRDAQGVENYHPQRLGGGVDFYRLQWGKFDYADSNYQKAGKPTGMSCNMLGREPGGTYSADFREIIGADIGYLTCYNRSGFLCPDSYDDSPY
ncbi:hypothetical protein PG997_001543 [Apiospora hydei]|uniref:Cyanovirin-N domain-containing protein n=1 Tax=Apiospora hydei TaxID=1337664 RepID=A0ABR1XE99_9PEZI